MGLQVSNVNVTTRDGDPITSFWILLEATEREKPTTHVEVILKAYRSEADLDAGYGVVHLIDTGAGLATDAPGWLGSIKDVLTPAQYASVDLLQIHNQVRDLLMQGDAHARWDELLGAERIWAGFGSGNVVTEMPT